MVPAHHIELKTFFLRSRPTQTIQLKTGHVTSDPKQRWARKLNDFLRGSVKEGLVLGGCLRGFHGDF